MRIFPKTLQIGDREGFAADKDIFGRLELGSGLSNLVGSVSDPMVIAIDGQWGSGKSTFLKMWAGQLRQKGFPVIYFDAFENDYLEDAFSALAAEIIGLLERQKKADEPKARAFLAKAVGAGKVIARGALKVGVKVATAGALASTDFDDLADAVSDEAEELADKHIGELLTKQAERKDTLRAFRDALRDLPDLLAESLEAGTDKTSKCPLIFIIDELDRCKPIFALQILERIKHFFSVENVHFVLGAHMGQLRNSVVAAYGAGIDANNYLQKFVQLTFHLTDRATHAEERTTARYISYLSRELVISDDPSYHHSCVEFTKRYSFIHNSSLRDIEHFLSNIALAAAFTTRRTLRPPPLICGLSILRVAHPALYVRAKQGTLDYLDAEKALGLNKTSKDQDEKNIYSDFEIAWWRFATEVGAPMEIIDAFSRLLFEYHIHDRFSLIPLIAHKVIDKLQMDA